MTALLIIRTMTIVPLVTRHWLMLSSTLEIMKGTEVLTLGAVGVINLYTHA